MKPTFTENLLSLGELVVKIEQDFYLQFVIDSAGQEMKKALFSGKKILIAGNGGSAAEAQHFAAELIGRYKKERMALPAIALTTDTSILTAIGNDYGYDTVFDRQVGGLGQAEDIYVVMSTSGNSKNILSSIKIAKEKGLKVVGLLGKDGGQIKNHCDFPIIIPSNDTARIQEIHLMLIHAWCEYIEKDL
jgi:D-sedoheptulose 7-phosphate isomerase